MDDPIPILPEHHAWRELALAHEARVAADARIEAARHHLQSLGLDPFTGESLSSSKEPAPREAA